MTVAIHEIASTAKNIVHENRTGGGSGSMAATASASFTARTVLICAGSMGVLHDTHTRQDGASSCPQFGHSNASFGKSEVGSASGAEG
jgi:hypothetical protein